MTTHRILPSDIDKLEAAICTLDVHKERLSKYKHVFGLLRDDLLRAKRLLVDQMADQPKEKASV